MKDAYYFPHDSNAKDDPKIVLLIEQLGLEGYGIYWVLIETLRDQPDYRYPLASVPGLARRFMTTTEKIKTVITGYSLFAFDEEDFFYSESLCARMKPLENKRKIESESGKLGNLKRWHPKLYKKVKNGVISLPEALEIGSRSGGDSGAIASKVKESKVNKSISIPTLEEVIDYFTLNGYTPEAAKKAYNYYDAGGWKDAAGKPVRSWKQKMRGVWFKDENKKKERTW